MKSHDYHVLIQTLIPIAYRELLSKGISDVLIKINHILRNVCSNKLHSQHSKQLEMNNTETIYNLEMFFPPSISNLMKHLSIHLSDETNVGG